MDLDVLWLKATPLKAYIEFTDTSRLHKETQYKKLYLENINFEKKAANWLLKSLQNIEHLSVINCKMEGIEFYRHVCRMTTLTSLSKI